MLAFYRLSIEFSSALLQMPFVPRFIYGCNLMQIHFKFYLNAIIYNRIERRTRYVQLAELDKTLIRSMRIHLVIVNVHSIQVPASAIFG